MLIIGLYTWKKEWIKKYESPWGILEKFKYANEIDDAQVYNIFKKEKSGIRISITKAKTYKSFVNMDCLDDNKLQNILGVNIKEINSINLKNILSILSSCGSINNLLKKHLSICPECIKDGYHSIWNQILFIDTCCIHNIKLIDCCPNCHTTEHYSINKYTSINRFKCICGYSYFNEMQSKIYFSSWGQSNDVKLNSKQKLLLSLSRKYQQQNIVVYSYNIYINDKSEWTLDNGIFNDFLKTTAINYISKNSYYIKIILSKNKTQHNACTKKYINYQDEIKTLYNPILKSIARHVRKSHNKIIRNNIIELKSKNIAFYPLYLRSDYTKNIAKPHIEPLAYAYLMWRRDIEGLVNYNDVHTIKRYKKISTFHYYYERLMTDYFYRKDYNISDTFINILQRLMGYMIFEHYKNWLKIAKTEGNDLNVYDYFEPDMPLFLINYGHKDSNYVEFHCWLKKK